MSSQSSPIACDCLKNFSRRDFLKTTTLATAGSLLPTLAWPDSSNAINRLPKSETLVKTLYNSLNESQRKMICFPFEHELRHEVENNWFIVKEARIGKFFNRDQQAMVREIFLNMHSEEYARDVMKQVEHDNGREGFNSCSVALFGEPDSGKFEFVLTGRHTTRRCDGDSVEGTAFGGPIFYGHAAQSFDEAPHHPGNVYWYQAKRANAVYQMMDEKQRKQALLGFSRNERGKQTVELTGKKTGLPGIPMTELTFDQKAEVRKVLDDLLAPFRKEDREESLKLIEKSGFEHLHLSFYKEEDVGSDGVWDVFQIEGPNMLWFFRGDPHVHTWVHIKDTV
ncbi:MAG: DUF3500 domain-containing protein [Verrucomicrobiae bacterium]|nr:DUF3500 domain-containing protein [Verrucomicrobiae bacterium]